MSEVSPKIRSAAARAELAQTLDAIEDKLNVPKQLGLLGKRARVSWDTKPIQWVIGATVAVIVVGGIIAWAVLSDD